MKTILLVTSVIALFATTGCIVDDRGGHHWHHWHGQLDVKPAVMQAKAGDAQAAPVVNAPATEVAAR